MVKKISASLELRICSLYNKGYGTMELCKLVKTSRSTIQRVLIRNNIKLRKTSPYKKKYNVQYFDTYTKENCYWAGFILADGCIRSDRDSLEIHLQKSDKKHLKKFAEAISFRGSLMKDKFSNACTISVSGKWFPKNLKKNFSIFPKKSLLVKFPKQVPLKFWKHIIRGYFDGDGCITTVKQSNGRLIPVISFVGTKQFLKFIRKYFFTLGVTLKSKNKYIPIMQNSISNNIGSIGLSGKNAMRILHFMFNDSDPNSRLDRKYKIYRKFVGEYYE